MQRRPQMSGAPCARSPSRALPLALLPLLLLAAAAPRSASAAEEVCILEYDPTNPALSALNCSSSPPTASVLPARISLANFTQSAQGPPYLHYRAGASADAFQYFLSLQPGGVPQSIGSTCDFAGLPAPAAMAQITDSKACKALAPLVLRANTSASLYPIEAIFDGDDTFTITFQEQKSENARARWRLKCTPNRPFPVVTSVTEPSILLFEAEVEWTIPGVCNATGPEPPSPLVACNLTSVAQPTFACANGLEISLRSLTPSGQPNATSPPFVLHDQEFRYYLRVAEGGLSSDMEGYAALPGTCRTAMAAFSGDHPVGLQYSPDSNDCFTIGTMGPPELVEATFNLETATLTIDFVGGTQSRDTILAISCGGSAVPQLDTPVEASLRTYTISGTWNNSYICATVPPTVQPTLAPTPVPTIAPGTRLPCHITFDPLTATCGTSSNTSSPVIIDLSRFQPAPGSSSYFTVGGGEISDFYIQLAGDGVPFEAAEHCQFPNVKPAAVQVGAGDSFCYLAGRLDKPIVAEFTYGGGGARKLSITFGGGLEGRTFTLEIDCDQDFPTPAFSGEVQEVLQLTYVASARWASTGLCGKPSTSSPTVAPTPPPSPFNCLFHPGADPRLECSAEHAGNYSLVDFVAAADRKWFYAKGDEFTYYLQLIGDGIPDGTSVSCPIPSGSAGFQTGGVDPCHILGNLNTSRALIRDASDPAVQGDRELELRFYSSTRMFYLTIECDRDADYPRFLSTPTEPSVRVYSFQMGWANSVVCAQQPPPGDVCSFASSGPDGAAVTCKDGRRLNMTGFRPNASRAFFVRPQSAFQLVEGGLPAALSCENITGWVGAIETEDDDCLSMGLVASSRATLLPVEAGSQEQALSISFFNASQDAGLTVEVHCNRSMPSVFPELASFSEGNGTLAVFFWNSSELCGPPPPPDTSCSFTVDPPVVTCANGPTVDLRYFAPQTGNHSYFVVQDTIDVHDYYLQVIDDGVPDSVVPLCQYPENEPIMVQVSRSPDQLCIVVALLTDFISGNYDQATGKLVIKFGGGTEDRNLTLTMRCDKTATVPKLAKVTETVRHDYRLDVQWASTGLCGEPFTNTPTQAPTPMPPDPFGNCSFVSNVGSDSFIICNDGASYNMTLFYPAAATPMFTFESSGGFPGRFQLVDGGVRPGVFDPDCPPTIGWLGVEQNPKFPNGCSLISKIDTGAAKFTPVPQSVDGEQVLEMRFFDGSYFSFTEIKVTCDRNLFSAYPLLVSTTTTGEGPRRYHFELVWNNPIVCGTPPTPTCNVTIDPMVVTCPDGVVIDLRYFAPQTGKVSYFALAEGADTDLYVQLVDSGVPSGIAPSCQYEFSKPAVVETTGKGDDRTCTINGLLTDVVVADYYASDKTLKLAFAGGTDYRTAVMTLRCNESATVPQLRAVASGDPATVEIHAEWAGSGLCGKPFTTAPTQAPTPAPPSPFDNCTFTSKAGGDTYISCIDGSVYNLTTFRRSLSTPYFTVSGPSGGSFVMQLIEGGLAPSLPVCPRRPPDVALLDYSGNNCIVYGLIRESQASVQTVDTATGARQIQLRFFSRVPNQQAYTDVLIKCDLRQTGTYPVLADFTYSTAGMEHAEVTFVWNNEMVCGPTPPPMSRVYASAFSDPGCELGGESDEGVAWAVPEDPSMGDCVLDTSAKFWPSPRYYKLKFLPKRGEVEEFAAGCVDSKCQQCAFRQSTGGGGGAIPFDQCFAATNTNLSQPYYAFSLRPEGKPCAGSLNISSSTSADSAVLAFYAGGRNCSLATDPGGVKLFSYVFGQCALDDRLVGKYSLLTVLADGRLELHYGCSSSHCTPASCSGKLAGRFAECTADLSGSYEFFNRSQAYCGNQPVPPAPPTPAPTEAPTHAPTPAPTLTPGTGREFVVSLFADSDTCKLAADEAASVLMWPLTESEHCVPDVFHTTFEPRYYQLRVSDDGKTITSLRLLCTNSSCTDCVATAANVPETTCLEGGKQAAEAGDSTGLQVHVPSNMSVRLQPSNEACVAGKDAPTPSGGRDGFVFVLFPANKECSLHDGIRNALLTTFEFAANRTQTCVSMAGREELLALGFGDFVHIARDAARDQYALALACNDSSCTHCSGKNLSAPAGQCSPTSLVSSDRFQFLSLSAVSQACPAPSPNKKDKDKKIGIIAGVAGGSLLLLILIIAAVVYRRRRTGTSRGGYEELGDSEIRESRA